MAYSLIYTAEFDGYNGQQNSIEILKKDYVGDSSVITCGAGAVKQVWGPDEPKALIKGCSLEVDLLNIEGSFPLSNFYSNEDDTFQILFYIGTDLKFKGYIVSDDCTEEMIDWTHNITISATDSLGLLKDIPLNQSPKAFNLVGTYPATAFSFVSPNYFYALTLNGILLPGDRIVITGSSNDGTYNITGEFGALAFYVAESVATTGADSGTIEIYRTALQGRFTLATILKFALAPTFLEINLHSYNNLRPVGGSVGRWLEDTYIDAGTWFNNEEFDKCEKVLTDIMQAFGCTFFQANGVWNIVRWDELRILPLINFLCYQYTADMVYIDDEPIPAAITIGNGSDILTGFTQSLIRPFKYVQETFDYRQPYDILRNAGFQRLGPLITEYTDGSDVVSEYVMQDWEVGYEWTSGGNGYIASTAQRFIRVRRNSIGEETERYGVIKGATGMFDSRAAAQCYPIEVRTGDKIRISWDWKTSVSQAGNVNIFFIVHIQTSFAPTPRASTNRYLNQFGQWRTIGQTNLTILSNVPAGSNTNQWQSVSVESEQIPVDGLLTFKLAQAGQNPQGTKETHYKNIRFEIFRGIAGNTTIIGQQHTQTQPLVVRNSSEEDRYADDAPTSAVSGALMLSSFTGPLQDLTTLWTRGGDPEELRLGQIVTRDEMMSRFKERLRLEGTILRSDITPLSVILCSLFPDKFFITGRVEIEHKINQATVTLTEQFEDGETEDDLVQDYNFIYLYETK